MTICDGCGEPARQWSLDAEGPWAGRVLCRECGRRRTGLKRLSLSAMFRFKVSLVLPPNDPMTPPVLRLLLAVDDVRRTQINLIEAHERLDLEPPQAKYLALGDFLYAMRLLFSHLHEAGAAVKTLDSRAKGRVDAVLQDRAEAAAALAVVRDFFNAVGYKDSFIARVRDVISFHYKDERIGAFAKAAFTNDALLESTAAEVGGLARMADPLVRAIMVDLNGGDFMIKEEHSTEISRALTIAGHLITFVDHLFDALIRQQPDAIVEQRGNGA